MRNGLLMSAALHGAVLFWAVAAFPTASEHQADLTPLPVDIVSASELTQIKAGRTDAKKTKPQPEPQRVEAPPPQRARDSAEPAPKKLAAKPEPKPESQPRAAKNDGPPPPMPLRRPRSVPKLTEPLSPKTRVAKRPEAKAKDFDPDRIAALLNKAPDAGDRRPPAPARKPQRAPEPPKPAEGRPEGQDLRMTMSEIDALRARISQCWNPPVGGLGADAIKVRLRLRLGRDGMLSDRPTVLNGDASPFFQAAADSAVRAVMLCQPYTLPATKYAAWRDMVLNFDPREMFGG